MSLSMSFRKGYKFLYGRKEQLQKQLRLSYGVPLGIYPNGSELTFCVEEASEEDFWCSVQGRVYVNADGCHS